MMSEMTMLNEEVRAIREGAAVVGRPEILTIRATGRDRVRFLNGMLSNDVAKLGAGEGQWAVKTSNKGRVEGVMRVRAAADAILLDIREVVAERVATELMKFLVMDDVSLADVTPERDVVAVYGPKARATLEGAGYSGLAGLGDLHCEDLGRVAIVRDRWLGVDGFELFVPAGTGDDTKAALGVAGARPVGPDAVEVVRVEAGVPLDGADLDADRLVLEARLERAIDFDKGCYIGQEVITRAHTRGGVKHRLVGLDLVDASRADRGSELWSPDANKPTGRITTAVESPTLGRRIGLGYVRIAHEGPGTRLAVRTEGSEGEVRVCALPFVPVSF